MSKATLFYTVRPRDTLSEIAHRHGTTVKELCRINRLKNPDEIISGQLIALKAEAVLKVGIQLLDRDRNPIPNARVRLEYCGKQLELLSGTSGRVPDIVTDTPGDRVRIYIARLDGTWKKITDVVSDWGNKLVTLISPKFKFEDKTRPHPKDEKGKPKRDRKDPDRRPVTPPANPKRTEGKGTPQSDYGDGKGHKKRDETTQDGLPVSHGSNDQAEFDFLKGYTGEKITKEDFENAAKNIGCEVAVIKTVAEVESKKAPFDGKHRPTILYERHVFARCTKPKGRYDQANPDISGLKKPYKPADVVNKKLIKQGKLAQYEIYGWSYSRLAKAYSLDKSAALKACSWGKFQILGENYKAAGFTSVFSFVEAMCRSEKDHLRAFVNFVIANKSLRQAAINKEWATFARNYNGKGYKMFKYDTKMKEAYKKYAK
jgi:LysM repeat protein